MRNRGQILISFGVVLATSAIWVEAAPGPPRLEKAAPFQFDLKRKEGESEVEFRRKRFNPKSIGDLAFSTDGRTLYTTIAGRGVWIWDLASRECTDVFEPKQNLQRGIVRTIFSPDGNTAAYLAYNRILLWDVPNRKVLGFLDEDSLVYWVAFSADGKSLIALSEPRREFPEGFRIWNLEKRTRVRKFKTSCSLYLTVKADSGIKTPVLVDLDDTSGKMSRFHLIDAFTGQEVLTCEWKKADAPPPYEFAMNRAETIVAVAGTDSPILLWNRNSGKLLARFKSLPHRCRHLAFSPDGKILAAAFNDERDPDDAGFRLYDVPSGKVLAEIKEEGGVRAWAFHPDSRLLAVKNDKEIEVWRIPHQWLRDK